MKELRNPHPLIYIGKASERFLSNRNNLYPIFVVAASLIIERYSEELNLNEKTVLAVEGLFLISAVWSFVRVGLHVRAGIIRRNRAKLGNLPLEEEDEDNPSLDFF